MLNSIVRVCVPASTSNLGPGLDSIGLALGLHNTFTFSLGNDAEDLEITLEGYGAQEIETGSDNLAYRSFSAVLQTESMKIPGVKIHQVNQIPVARGLGGSSTAILAGILAAYVFLEKEPSVDQILTHSLRIDPFVDNAIASLIGGLVVSTIQNGRMLYTKVPIPNGISCIVFVPDFPIKTGESRKVLPKQVSFEDAVSNVRSTALLIAAFATGKKELLRYAMKDRLHQPYRASLVPGLYEVFDAALEAGAYGVSLSGAGSGILAIVDENDRRVAEAMEKTGRTLGLNGYSMQLPIEQNGAQIQAI